MGGKNAVYRSMSVVLAAIIWFSAPEMSVAQEGSTTKESSVEWGVTVGAGAAQALLNPSEQPWAVGYDLRVGWDLRLSKTWRLAVHAARRRYWDDTTTTDKFKLPQPTKKAANTWNNTIFNLSARRIFSPDNRWHPYLQAGLGLTRWDIADYSSGEIREVTGKDGNPEKFEATEFHTNFGAGLEYDLSSSISARTGIDFYYLTGAGASFASAVDDFRSRGNMVFSLALTAYFGRGETPPPPQPGGWLTEYPNENRTPGTGDNKAAGEAKKVIPESNKEKQQKFERTDYDKDGDGVHDATDLCPDTPPGTVVDAYGCPPDEDGDGVIDGNDQCPFTPAGAFVDSVGCPFDSDGDKVYDGLDFCPETPARDIAYVDNTGCVIDRDRDRIPDYRDDCPDSKPGAIVNALGCIADGDGDGVLDSLDVCPDSPRGLAVDQDGCLVMTQLSRKLMLFPDFEPGWDKLDVVSLKILDDLANRLQRAPNVFVHIRAYTDNIGEATANEDISQRRADRARLYLIDQGIAPERIRAIGLGEIDFIASNDTAAGRKRNRRLEITFEYR